MTSGTQRESIVRFLKQEQPANFLPIKGLLDASETEGMESEAKREGAEEQGEAEEWREHVEELSKRVAQHFEDEHERDAVSPPGVKAPAQPTQVEWEQHQGTHTPYKAWCPHCAAARAVRRKHPRQGRSGHIVPDVDGHKDGPIKLSKDYMYLHDRRSNEGDAQYNPPYLVAIEHRHGRCWAYQVATKGAYGAAHWLPRRMVQDWDNNGFKGVKIHFKSDQEPSIVELQSAIQMARFGSVILTNSPVGESESNGRVENTIRRIQEKTRVLRHQLGNNMKAKIPTIQC